MSVRLSAKTGHRPSSSSSAAARRRARGSSGTAAADSDSVAAKDGDAAGRGVGSARSSITCRRRHRRCSAASRDRPATSLGDIRASRFAYQVSVVTRRHRWPGPQERGRLERPTPGHQLRPTAQDAPVCGESGTGRRHQRSQADRHGTSGQHRVHERRQLGALTLVDPTSVANNGPPTMSPVLDAPEVVHLEHLSAAEDLQHLLGIARFPGRLVPEENTDPSS